MKILSVDYPVLEADQNKIMHFKKSYDQVILPKLKEEHSVI